VIPQILSDPAGWQRQTRQRFWRLAPSDAGMVTLRHNRIYILPTRRGWAFAFTLTLMLLTSMNYALSLGYALTFLFGGLIQAAMLHTFRNLSRLGVESAGSGDSEPEAFVDDALIFRISLRNISPWARRNVRVAAAGGWASELSIPAEGTATVELHVPAARRGRLPLGRITIDSTYPLGLWRAWAYVHFPLYGIVYPKPETAAPPAPAAGHGAGARSVGSGDDEFSGLRGYLPGDPLPRVAWKIAARGMGLFTKEFDGAGGGDVHADWSLTPAAFTVEQRLSRLTAWVLQASQRGQQYRLDLPGSALGIGRGDGQRRRALAMLALHGLSNEEAAR
jgi:uncharacterized protein (DUF58 family)